MNGSAGNRVVHLVPPNGGGVDRLVRDICSRRPQDWLLHVSDDQCVVECAAGQAAIPIATSDLGDLVQRGVFGRPAVLHSHSATPAVRRATQLMAAAMQLPYVITLHDVKFADTAAGAAPGDHDERLAFIRSAARCIVPSGFMRGVAMEAMGGAFDCIVVENGVDVVAPRRGPGGPGSRFPIAVIGAVGQHKGLAHLAAVAAALPQELQIALIGYAEGQLKPGWLAEDRIWVHGVFEPAELPTLVADYGSVIAFFPNGQPESYCYALSDAWLAGLSVLGPDSGAIGERVRAHGAGSLYDPEAPPAQVAHALTQQLARAEGGHADVAAAVRSLSSVAAMVDGLNGIYDAVGTPTAPPDLDALSRAAMNNLDSRFFRKELLRLQGDLAAAERQRDNALQELRGLADNFAKRGDWIDHLQRGQQEFAQRAADLTQQIDDLQALVHSQRHELQARVADLEQLQAEHVALQQVHAALQMRFETLMGRLTWPLRLLPAPWRARIIKVGKRMFFVEGGHG